MIGARKSGSRHGKGRWFLRLSILVVCLFALIVVYVSNQFLTQRFASAIVDRSEARLSLYVTNLTSELQRNSVVPQLLARSPELVTALATRDYTDSSAHLVSFVAEIGSASLLLLDRDGVTVAATAVGEIDARHADDRFFADALASDQTVYTTERGPSGQYRYVFARKIVAQEQVLGVIAVEVNSALLQAGWVGGSEVVLVLDGAGQIIMSSEPSWRGLTEPAALSLNHKVTISEGLRRALRAAIGQNADAYLRGEAMLRHEARVPHQGWKMVSFTANAAVRTQVNGILALEVMVFAIILAVMFWFMSRKTASRLVFFQRESAELRALNRRLQREVAEREKVEQTLQVAEQTIAQSSKLAALGEMSAAVSHELNQPLAAMKTYLAGARLLLQRERPEEAMSSFQRIDDLIERMGAITRQLKSYARKGDDAFEPMDIRASVSTALAMMEPQLKIRDVNIIRSLPNEPVMVLGDRLRLEQVIVNLLRNALDATKGASNPTVEILLVSGHTISLQIRDNGEGIEDLNALFEPFYTTKQPGDGTGLGLAISSGIVSELGGRLTARNAVDGGAIFEVQLPRIQHEAAAAE
ncbi:two-component system, NtrC family, C4-dicarboxylate transport sensor histidine kinase DctB [Yoonia tamlensis]|uniref:C4-dicarboxylate transport sensor protein DctB n=1 Tax=Yoonia tamlensis TaxID=390270 RepID=A0A1I6G897_9RHOB|nr:ATP-binding protein [Yoonia tamlensis]SFR38404.1 two-component system, NtrC family, C4-dicarboxylate transport sensor histidine kinase DctB [Yoonia tamlensis]